MILQEYLHYTQNSESPESYHIWVFLSMIAAIVGKKTWLRCNYFTVYPNMYIILVSLPGVGKKSTAMRIGREVVMESDAKVQITFDAITREALIGEMEASFYIFETPNGKRYGSSPVTAIASELITLLSSGPTMVEFLTDIYDSDKLWRYKTKNKGENAIMNPCLNVISGVTTATFCSRIIKDAVAGGFISRSVIIYDNETRIESPFSLPNEAQLKSRQKVVDRFVEVSQMYGEVIFSKEAKEYFEKWYIEEMQSARHKTAFTEFHSRKHTHVLKTAMLLSLSELTLEISVLCLKAAIELVNRVEHNMKFIYMSAGANRHGDIYIKILSALYIGDTVEYSELLNIFLRDIDEEEFLKQLNTLQSAKYIQIVTDMTAKPVKRVVKITQKGKEMFKAYDK